MPVKQIDVLETNLEELIALIQQGIEILLIQDGVPVARMLPIEATSKKERILGMHRGSIWVSDDFDDPLPDEFWFGEE